MKPTVSQVAALPLLLLMFNGAPAYADVQFGRCDASVSSSAAPLVAVASAGVDDSGHPVLLVLQGGAAGRVIRIAVNPALLGQACDLAISAVGLSTGSFVPLALTVGDLNADRRFDVALAGSDGV